MNFPVTLAADVFGTDSPVTTGLMVSVAALAFAWGEARSKLSQAIEDLKAETKRNEAREARIGALELGKAASDQQLANINHTILKIDAKLDKVLDIEAANARRRSTDIAA